jgi:hypothetical protein
MWFVAGCDSRQSEASRLISEAPPAREKAQPKVEQRDPEKEAFIKLVQQNADDPSGLEIVLWENRQGNSREVRFRCNQVGHTRQMQSWRLGTTPPPTPPGNPVMLENASVEYEGGEIRRAVLSRTYQVWYSRSNKSE